MVTFDLAHLVSDSLRVIKPEKCRREVYKAREKDTFVVRRNIKILYISFVSINFA